MDQLQRINDYSVDFISPLEIEQELRNFEVGLRQEAQDAARRRSLSLLHDEWKKSTLSATVDRLKQKMSVVGIRQKYYNALAQTSYPVPPRYLKLLPNFPKADLYSTQFYFTLEYLNLIGAICIDAKRDEINDQPKQFYVSDPSNTELNLLDFMFTLKTPPPQHTDITSEYLQAVKGNSNNLFKRLRWYKKQLDGKYEYPYPQCFREGGSIYVCDTTTDEISGIRNNTNYIVNLTDLVMRTWLRRTDTASGREASKKSKAGC